MSETIDIELTRGIGRLARIELSDEQLRMFSGQLRAILDYFDKLQELDTENVDPMVHAVEIHNVLAEDEPAASLSPDEALINAPARDGNHFKVPKVLGDS